MKTLALYLSAALLPMALLTHGQGTLVFDQQSATNETPDPFGAGSVMQNIPAPWGQSFTPDLSSVGFVRLKLNDKNIDDALGVTLSVNLRAGSISGTVLSSSDPVVFPNAFSGVVDFLFPAPVSVTSGVTLYFEPIVQSGGPWATQFAGEDVYPGGTAIFSGQPSLMSDFWFREGIVVPEPSVLALIGLGAGLAVLRLLRLLCRQT